MSEKTKRGRGGTSKGPRHAFTVKLDLERSGKLKEILRTFDIAGTDYLGPIVEAHVDAVDLRQLGNEEIEEEALAAGEKSDRLPRPAVQRKPTPGEALHRAKTLAVKINLLLTIRSDASGKPYTFPMIRARAMKAGFSLSGTRWSQLKEGEVQMVPDDCLRAVAQVFNVDSEYLLSDNAELPAELALMLPKVRIKKLSEVRAFAMRSLDTVAPEVLSTIREVFDQAIQEESVRRNGALERSFRWVAISRADCRADNRRRAFAGELSR